MVESLKLMRKKIGDGSARDNKRAEILKSVFMILTRTKIGRVMGAWEKWKSLPERKTEGTNVKGNKFEVGLRRFVDRTLKKGWGAFRDQLDQAQVTKKRAVIQLINVTMSTRKRLYSRWLSFT